MVRSTNDFKFSIYVFIIHMLVLNTCFKLCVFFRRFCMVKLSINCCFYSEEF